MGFFEVRFEKAQYENGSRRKRKGRSNDDDELERSYFQKRNKEQLHVEPTSSAKTGKVAGKNKNDCVKRDSGKQGTKRNAVPSVGKIKALAREQKRGTATADEAVDDAKAEKRRQKKARQKAARLLAKQEQTKAKKHKTTPEKETGTSPANRTGKKKAKRKWDETNSDSPEEIKHSSRATGGEFGTLRLGVKYKDIQMGNGPFVQDRKKVRVNYTLRAKNKTGKIIDSGRNFAFRVGKGEVIKGWDIGLDGMRQGGVRQLIVPPKAGYGNRNVGAGSGGILFFEIQLLSC
eukprot:CAMPEP_0196806784 /NCGR_PEP_ID=MMETSP1362-20130617/6710_1 /TAXON_ID=163516 /ORGANISM="Leptocylindrus danicus, Strain CCMP1856" /LENGTH=289 /DNA_ID=CAMNT_0042180427 /DNA_START=128 /DNA_END=997 /DNA_ORIENTATION=+